MPTDKRQRQKQARQERLEAERKAAQRAATRRRFITGVSIAAGVFVILALIAFLSDGDDDDDTTGDSTTTVPVGTTPPVCDSSSEGGTLGEAPTVTAPPAPFPTTLECTDLTVGDGEAAAVGDTITVDYAGIVASTGAQFDSSFDGEPAEFELAAGALIQGWVDGIPGMKVGGRRQLVIPPDLAYRAAGNPAAGIGPNETLVFVIDLVAVA